MTGPGSEPVTEADTEAADVPETEDVFAQPDSEDTVDAALDEAVSDASGSDRETELIADLQRVHAEYANYRRRAERDKVSAQQYGKGDLIRSLLPVLDDLDRARAHGDLEAGPLRAVADKITETLSSAGLAAFGAEGDPFDPALHEAVQHEGEGSRPVIGTVYRQGFRLGDRVLRTAMVVVVDGPETPAAATQE
ncbi:nucleotide exchange factor GrpE [Williamsia sp. 1135]|uniref:nucleotide exchange factor GrpE n=1 Tax=Williamsia sp. 1135 TaxID=1889262 RepID=UPI000A11D649|nr:nucleotide exchange factor GrpE [Williamsia sp. 1135]ORM33130.1 nucleotide exchange factor GrpE [Williamsia sp. 1135]